MTDGGYQRLEFWLSDGWTKVGQGEALGGIILLAEPVLLDPTGPAAVWSGTRVGACASTRGRCLPKWLYDDRGCELTNEITCLPEYYPFDARKCARTRRVAAVLQAAPSFALACQHDEPAQIVAQDDLGYEGVPGSASASAGLTLVTASA